MARVAISYRREDSAGITGRIFDRLNEHYQAYDVAGGNIVFMDYDSIPIGIDFRQHIRKALDTCDVLLVIIGPRWAGDDQAGSKRIMHDTDWVRIEVETALKKEIPVVPVLIDRTPMPDPDKLPEGIRDLAYRQAVVIDSQIDFNAHLERLTRQLDLILNLSPPSRPILVARPGQTARRSAPPREEPRVIEADETEQPDPRKRYGRLAVCAAIVAVLLCGAAAGGWFFFADRDGIGPLYHYTSRELGVTFDFPRNILLMDATEERNRKLTLTTMTGERVVTVTRELRADKDIKFDRQMEHNEFTKDGYLVTLDKPDNRSANWYVLSGAKDGSIFYVRRWYAADSVISMDFRYSKELLTLFDKIIGPMANKLSYTETAPTIGH